MRELKELEDDCRAIGRTIQGGLPETVGFVLFLFDFGEGGHMTWISNANRDDMMLALREFMSKEGH